MNRISPEFKSRRIESASEIVNSDLEINVLTAEDVDTGEQREDILALVATARPDLHERGEVVPFLDEAREGEGFKLITARKHGSGLLIATAWAERLDVTKHVDQDQKLFAERVEHLGLNDLVSDAYYAPNASVHPHYRRRKVGSTVIANILTDPEIFSDETAIFYRRSADRPGGQELERAFGIGRVLQGMSRDRDVARYLNVIVTSPTENLKQSA